MGKGVRNIDLGVTYFLNSPKVKCHRPFAQNRSMYFFIKVDSAQILQALSMRILTCTYKSLKPCRKDKS